MGILMGGEEVRYESLSGGEKRRVDIALCLAMNKFIAIKYDVPHGILGIMILDEIFSYIDRVGEEAIAGLIEAEGNNKTIIVISHTPELASYARSIWTVRKDAYGITSMTTEEVAK